MECIRFLSEGGRREFDVDSSNLVNFLIIVILSFISGRGDGGGKLGKGVDEYTNCPGAFILCLLDSWHQRRSDVVVGMMWKGESPFLP